MLASETLLPGQTTQATAVALDATGHTLSGRATSFSSSNTSVATVASGGTVTAVAAGTTAISATVGGHSGAAPLMVCQAGLEAPVGVSPTLFVSATIGNDATANGTCAAPFRTITRGVALAQSGDVVWVAPGNYDAGLGEVFPIAVAAGVSLIGDEANKGQGTTATNVVGGGNVSVGGDCGTYGATIFPGAHTVIAGLQLANTIHAFDAMTLLIRESSVTVRRNSIVNNGGASAVYICNNSTNHVITDNVIRDNGGTGLGFIGGGVGSRVEHNVITANHYGVEYDSPGGDLGGGSTGSVGGNLIFCNTINDLWTNTPITINAALNLWDHVPLSGNDVFNNAGATIVTTGAATAPGNCP